MFTTGMSFGLGEEIEALRDTVHRWAQAKVAPRAAEIDKTNNFPMELCSSNRFRSTLLFIKSF